MTNFIHNYFHPLSGKLIFWNVLLLIFVKLVLPQSAFQLATLIGSMPAFDSREIIKVTNEARSANNLSPLKASTKLDAAAEQKLNDMAVKEYFAHVSPTGVTPWFWIQQAQYKYKVAGENLAIGFTTSQDTVRAWLNSPSHKANLLNSQYQDMGVAVKGVKIGGTTGILVVQMFGKPSVQVAVVNPTTTPYISPKISPSLSPSATNGQTKGEIISDPDIITATGGASQNAVVAESGFALQHVSTDTEIPSVVEPVQIKFKDAESIKKWTGIMNNTFAMYSLLLAILSIISFFVLEKSHLPVQASRMALKMSLHSAIFVLALLLPSAGITLQALIF